MTLPKQDLPVVQDDSRPVAEGLPNNGRDKIRLAAIAAAALFSYLGIWRLFFPFDVVAIGATLLGGYPVFVSTFRSLLHRAVNMEVSMTVAIVASLLLGQFTVAVVVTFFVLLSEFIEAYAVDKGRATIVKLEKTVPRKALVRRNGVEAEVDADSLVAGDVVVVRDGERVPVDGVLVKGSGFVNQSAITGEALAVEKTIGDQVFAGSVDESGIFEVRAEKIGQTTIFGQIIKLLEEAEARKAPIQRLSDKLATWLVEFTIIFAVVTFVLTRNLISTISVIVVAGACGVAAGTPLAIVAAIGGLARQGVVVKGGVYVQEMSGIDTVVIDKTGTLTLGDPEVTDIVPLDSCDEKRLLTYAASAERLSNHPLAHAILSKAREAGVEPAGGGTADYLVGRGMISSFNGEQVIVGNTLLMSEQRVPLSDTVEATITTKVSEGKTTVVVAHGGHVCGLIGISDRVRDESRSAIRSLRKMGISTIMLTGDNAESAKGVARQVGIEETHAQLLPADKISFVEKLSATGKRIAMVGDGVNDAPALARANVGIGMGKGTDVAIEEADVVLMNDDLENVPTAIKTSKRAYGAIMENFYGTLIVDGIGLTLAFQGLLNPLLAAGIHVTSELVFILNSARLIR